MMDSANDTAQHAGDKHAGDKEALAEDRTDWAFERTLLANDRTFSAWIRTGLTTVAAGFGVTRLLPDVQPAWLIPWLGVLFVLVGGGILLIGYWSHRSTLHRLTEEPGRRAVGWLIGAITMVLVLGAAVSLWLVL